MVLEMGNITVSGSTAAPNLAAWLEKRCKDEKLSYRRAAAKASISHATIAAIRRGNRPSAAIIVKLANAFSDSGKCQRGALEDFLLSLCGYRSKQDEVGVSEPLGRLIDKTRHFNEAQLKIIEQFADFVAKAGDSSWIK